LGDHNLCLISASFQDKVFYSFPPLRWQLDTHWTRFLHSMIFYWSKLWYFSLVALLPSFIPIQYQLEFHCGIFYESPGNIIH
jgi:hypothetical protein